jgi:hypothetical protein
MHWPARQRCAGNRQDRTRQPAGRNADEAQRSTTGRRERQGLAEMARCNDSVVSGRCGQCSGLSGQPSGRVASARRGRSMPRGDARVKCRDCNADLSSPVLATTKIGLCCRWDDAHEIGGIACPDFIHDAGTMDLHGTRADAKPPASFLVGSTAGDFCEHFAFTRGQTSTRKIDERTVSVVGIFKSIGESLYGAVDARQRKR